MDITPGLVIDPPGPVDTVEDVERLDTSVSGNDLVEDVLQQQGDGALDGNVLREQYQGLLSDKQRVVELLESERFKNTQLENQLALGNINIFLGQKTRNIKNQFKACLKNT